MSLTPTQRGLRLQEIVKHLNMRPSEEGLKQCERAWIAWQLQRRLGIKEDWPTYAKRSIFFVRHRATMCMVSHEILFDDGWVIVTKAEYGRDVWSHEVVEVIHEDAIYEKPPSYRTENNNHLYSLDPDRLV